MGDPAKICLGLVMKASRGSADINVAYWEQEVDQSGGNGRFKAQTKRVRGSTVAWTGDVVRECVWACASEKEAILTKGKRTGRLLPRFKRTLVEVCADNDFFPFCCNESGNLEI